LSGSIILKIGFEEARVSAWINQGLTDEVSHQALVTRTRQTDLVRDAGYPIGVSFGKFFVLARHGDVRELMGLRAYGLQVVGGTAMPLDSVRDGAI
jgi:hypothetical protein